MTKDEFIAFNLATGNIIADAEQGKVFATRGAGGVKLKEPVELEGSNVNGYLVVNIRCDHVRKQCRIHRIIWISKHGVLPEGYCIDHINNNKHDNRIANLQLLTPAENSQKAKEDGLYKCGLDNPATKIDPEMKDEIAFIYAMSSLSYRQLADMYGISKSRVGQIIKEVGWTDIGDWIDSKGKTRKSTDGARYKALGNSIALPWWDWMIGRLCSYYDRPVEMASLFDGISGFCLCFARHGGIPVWASEIEDFPIAVAKKHFGDDDKGIKGDFEDFLETSND